MCGKAGTCCGLEEGEVGSGEWEVPFGRTPDVDARAPAHQRAPLPSKAFLDTKKTPESARQMQ